MKTQEIEIKYLYLKNSRNESMFFYLQKFKTLNSLRRTIINPKYNKDITPHW